MNGWVKGWVDGWRKNNNDKYPWPWGGHATWLLPHSSCVVVLQSLQQSAEWGAGLRQRGGSEEPTRGVYTAHLFTQYFDSWSLPSVSYSSLSLIGVFVCVCVSMDLGWISMLLMSLCLTAMSMCCILLCSEVCCVTYSLMTVTLQLVSVVWETCLLDMDLTRNISTFYISQARILLNLVKSLEEVSWTVSLMYLLLLFFIFLCCLTPSRPQRAISGRMYLFKSNHKIYDKECFIWLFFSHLGKACKRINGCLAKPTHLPIPIPNSRSDYKKCLWFLNTIVDWHDLPGEVTPATTFESFYC